MYRNVVYIIRMLPSQFSYTDKYRTIKIHSSCHLFRHDLLGCKQKPAHCSIVFHPAAKKSLTEVTLFHKENEDQLGQRN